MSRIDEAAARMRAKANETEKQVVRVALFGQPGSGKSSIINALIGREAAKVGVYTDVTVDSEAIEWNGVKLVDLPGYDTARFPRETYYKKFDIPTFDLFLCVMSGKLRASDTAFLQELGESAKVCLLVRNHSDTIWQKGRRKEELELEIAADIRKQANRPEAEVLFTSCRTGSGLAELVGAIDRHLAPANRERWARTAKAYSQAFLDEKRAACDNLVTIYAGLSAANGLNPIPGVDVAVDVGMLLKLLGDIRDAYGLDRNRLDAAAALVPLQPMVKEILEHATREGILLLLKRFAGRTTVKAVSKYIPIVGQVIAAGIGFAITKLAGDAYHEACYAVARSFLERELQEGSTV
jgi:GTP-binding protein EngB required for normal cell division/uncharacterized protein (DUF697 family)